MRAAFLAASLLGLMTAAAAAQPVSGFYMQGSAGLALPGRQSPASSSPVSSSQQGASAMANDAINGGPGSTAVSSTEAGSAGWGFGNGLRVEVQGMHIAGSHDPAAGGEAGGGDP